MGPLLLEPSNFQGLDVYGYITKIESLLKESAGPVTQPAGSSAEKKESAGSQVKESASSAVSNKGGIDFRSLPIVTQAMSNLSANLRDSPLRGESLLKVNLADEWSQIERLVSSGITPSSERLKEYIQTSCTQDNITQDRDKILLCISDILRLQEERCDHTNPTLRDILVVLEAMRDREELKEVFLGV